MLSLWKHRVVFSQQPFLSGGKSLGKSRQEHTASSPPPSCTHNVKSAATWPCFLHYKEVVLGLFASLDGDGGVFCLQLLPPLLLLLPHTWLWELSRSKLGAHWEMQYLQEFYSMACAGDPEPFPEVKCLKGSTASEAAVGWSQRPYHYHISLTSGRLGVLSSAIPPSS